MYVCNVGKMYKGEAGDRTNALPLVHGPPL